MKPTFALDLTRDAIAILHRTPKGWLSIGEVAFDAPDLDDALDYVRKTAHGLSPISMTTKVILPAGQILYTEVHAPGPSREDKRRQIAAALEGRTPYDVKDLVFDWSGKGATVKVAVVARETLQEAEDFATTHRLNPVSFVAIPEEGTFVGEAWFGPTGAAASILASGETVERDREAVTILRRDLPATDPAAHAEPAALPDATTPEAAPKAAADDTAADEPLPGLEEALNADLPEMVADSAAPRPAGRLTPELDELGDALPGGQVGSGDTATSDTVVSGEPHTSPAPNIPAAQPETPILATPQLLAPLPPSPAPETQPETSAETSAETPPKPPEVEEAPFAHVTDTAAFPEDTAVPPDDESATPKPKQAAADDLDSDIPPAPSTAALVAFASRRSAANAMPGPSTAPALGAAASAQPITQPSAKLAAPAARTTPPKGFSGLVTAPTIPGTRAKPKLKIAGGDIPRPGTAAPTTVKSPARPGGTFGASVPPRNRSGIVFMVMVVLLLLGLALVGVWASYFLQQSEDSAPSTIDLASNAIPGIDDEMLADMQDPEGMTDPLPEAEGEVLPEGGAGALATETLPGSIGVDPDEATPDESLAAAPEAEAAPESVTELAVEPAPETTVATDLTAAQAPVEDQDEIFLSAMDAPPPALDALALPVPAATVDALPETPMPPPAFGTVYAFDANGLLKPTPEGIVSPEGVMLIAGKPPILPPQRSELAAAAAVAASSDETVLVTEAGTAAGTESAELAPAPSDPAMAGFRPRPRPENLVPATTPSPDPTTEDDARLATDGTSDVATIRPLPRPATVLAAASASLPSGGIVVADAAPSDSGVSQAEALLAAAALEAENPSIVAISKRPAARPDDLSRAVEAAVAAAVRAPEPEAEVIEVAAAAPAPELKPEELDEIDEPDAARPAPSIPTKASVAKQATFANAINLSKINLIGTYGTDSRRYALIRQSNGRYKKVKVGDKIDGGTVKAITETEVRYQKGGKLVSLKMPKA